MIDFKEELTDLDLSGNKKAFYSDGNELVSIGHAMHPRTPTVVTNGNAALCFLYDTSKEDEKTISERRKEFFETASYGGKIEFMREIQSNINPALHGIVVETTGGLEDITTDPVWRERTIEQRVNQWQSYIDGETYDFISNDGTSLCLLCTAFGKSELEEKFSEYCFPDEYYEFLGVADSPKELLSRDDVKAKLEKLFVEAEQREAEEKEFFASLGDNSDDLPFD